MSPQVLKQQESSVEWIRDRSLRALFGPVPHVIEFLHGDFSLSELLVPQIQVVPMGHIVIRAEGWRAVY